LADVLKTTVTLKGPPERRKLWDWKEIISGNGFAIKIIACYGRLKA
jgi:hypothetical protein